ncbi:MAG: hypothetical protein Q7T11_03775 [Deltaproteobacteria bacterium]|nr:hypothetical protein [Deltaproteobacteria bacterium]
MTYGIASVSGDLVAIIAFLPSIKDAISAGRAATVISTGVSSITPIAVIALLSALNTSVATLR